MDLVEITVPGLGSSLTNPRLGDFLSKETFKYLNVALEDVVVISSSTLNYEIVANGQYCFKQFKVVLNVLGGFVCENHKTPVIGNGSELHVFSHLPRCGVKVKKVQLIDQNFCCDGQGNHIECAPKVTKQ